MRPHSPKNQKGFTLIEILIVTVVIAIMSIAALSSYVKSQDTIKFLAAVKESVNILKEVRSYALSNKMVTIEGKQVVPNKYGANITMGSAGQTSNKIIIFADNPTAETQEKYDSSDYPLKTFYLTGSDSEYKSTKYRYTTNSKTSPYAFTFFYDTTTARFSVVEELNGEGKSYAYIKISEEDSTGTEIRKKYIILFKVSGNPEVMDDFPENLQ